MNVAIVTGNSDLLFFKTVVPVKRAINTNVIMISGDDYFLVSTVVMMVVMRAGRTANTNVVMVARNNHFLLPIVVVVVVVG